MDIFAGLTTIDWGFEAADVFSNGMFIVSSLAGFILLGLAVGFAPQIVSLIKSVVGKRKGA